MSARRTIPRRAIFDLDGTLAEYLTNRSLKDRAAYYEDRGKKALMTHLETTGVIDSEGHRSLELDEAVPYSQYKDGKPQAQFVRGIKRQKRTSRVLDPDKTLAYLKEHDLVARCTETVVEVDEAAVLAANYEGAIPDDELEDLYVVRDTYAFYLLTEDA